ncbi:Protein of unknown function [Gryllus bimaculatus]|nr:Protein of unknown function [Gryllus bimaculatus]
MSQFVNLIAHIYYLFNQNEGKLKEAKKLTLQKFQVYFILKYSSSPVDLQVEKWKLVLFVHSG